MFINSNELKWYVMENYPEITDSRIDDDHWDFQCSFCEVTRGFQVTKRAISGDLTNYGQFDQDLDSPKTYSFRCPVCKGFKQWIIYELSLPDSTGKYERRYFRVSAVPNDGLEEIEELPLDPPSLRTAYKQAIRAMDANANIAAAAMFRRALQIITRDLLGAKPGTLDKELNEVVGKSFNGGTISTSFASVGYIIKEAGNQGAHPDKDPDLLDFTPEDAEDLQNIFMEVVSELFVIPAAKERAKQEFMARRKITPKITTP